MNIFNKLLCAFSFAILTFSAVSTPAEACPKRFRVIKFVGRQVKNGVKLAGKGVKFTFNTVKEIVT